MSNQQPHPSKCSKVFGYISFHFYHRDSSVRDGEEMEIFPENSHCYFYTKHTETGYGFFTIQGKPHYMKYIIILNISSKQERTEKW